MRNVLLFVLSMSVLSAAAVTLDVAQLQEPAFADREASGDAALPGNRFDSLRVVAHTNGLTDRIEYVWGLDLSGTLQGAGGVGGLLFEKRNGQIFIPLYDANGNVTAYVDAGGNVRAKYVYDAFGCTVAQSQSGDMDDTFAFRFSTKYCDAETELYYYGYRFYSATQGRWLNRDPIEELGGIHLYGYCRNNSVNGYDLLGLETVGSMITRIFVSRLLTPVFNVFRSNHYLIYDFKNEMAKDLSVYTRPALENEICAYKDKSRANWQTVTLKKKNVAGSGFVVTDGLKGFWLSTSCNVTLEGSVQIRCASNGNVYYRNIFGIWKWNDDVDANSFPGIAWLKGEGKTVFANEAPWATAVIEGIWDIIGDTLLDTDFGVTVEWLDSTHNERLARCGQQK